VESPALKEGGEQSFHTVSRAPSGPVEKKRGKKRVGEKATFRALKKFRCPSTRIERRKGDKRLGNRSCTTSSRKRKKKKTKGPHPLKGEVKTSFLLLPGQKGRRDRFLPATKVVSVTALLIWKKTRGMSS